MLKSLTNKLSCGGDPCNISNLYYKIPKDDNLLIYLRDNIDFVESYVFDCSRFLAPLKIGYVRLKILYSYLTSLSDI